MGTKKKPKDEPPPNVLVETVEELGIVSGNGVKAEKVQWDWPEMILRNSLNLIDGNKGSGKSSVMATIASALCAGKKLPESKSAGPKGACLWFGSEESFGGSVVTRWKANGCDANQILTVQEHNASGYGRVIMPMQEDRLRTMVRYTKARVIVADPYTALGDVSLDTRHEQSTRLYLESLARVAHEEGVTILLSRHLRKGRSGSLLDHGLGSVTIAAVCRSVLRAERDKQNPSTCFLGCVAGNHGKAPGVVPYTLVEKDGSVFVAKFGARKDKEMEEVLEGGDEPDERDASADARSLLSEALAKGPVDAKVILEEAKKNGIGERTLRRAKAEMRVVSKRGKAGKGVAANWTWSLPRE